MATKKAAAKQTAAPAKAPVQKMTKTQLIRYLAEQMEVPPKQIAAFFDLLIGTRDHPRMGRNPATGEAIKIKPKRR